MRQCGLQASLFTESDCGLSLDGGRHTQHPPSFPAVYLSRESVLQSRGVLGASSEALAVKQLFILQISYFGSPLHSDMLTGIPEGLVAIKQILCPYVQAPRRVPTPPGDEEVRDTHAFVYVFRLHL